MLFLIKQMLITQHPDQSARLDLVLRSQVIFQAHLINLQTLYFGQSK